MIAATDAAIAAIVCSTPSGCSAQSLPAHLAQRRSGGVFVQPSISGEPGGSGKYVSSQCFAFQRSQLDFFSMRGLSSEAKAGA